MADAVDALFSGGSAVEPEEVDAVAAPFSGGNAVEPEEVDAVDALFSTPQGQAAAVDDLFEQPTQQAASPPPEATKFPTFRQYFGIPEDQRLTATDAMQGTEMWRYLDEVLKPEYENMPMGTAEETVAKLRFGREIRKIKHDLARYNALELGALKNGMSVQGYAYMQSPKGQREQAVVDTIDTFEPSGTLSTLLRRVSRGTESAVETTISLGSRAVGSNVHENIAGFRKVQDEFQAAQDKDTYLAEKFGAENVALGGQVVESLTGALLSSMLGGTAGLYGYTAANGYDRGLNEAQEAGITGAGQQLYAGFVPSL